MKKQYHWNELPIQDDNDLVIIGFGPKPKLNFVELDDKDCGCFVATAYPHKTEFLSLYATIVGARYCKEHDPDEIRFKYLAKRVKRANEREHLQK